MNAMSEVMDAPMASSRPATATPYHGTTLMARFRLQAVVDWVELKLILASPTQARHLRNRMPPTWGLPYARPGADQDPNACSVFYVRVQDPDLGRLPQEVASLDAQALVVSIEVALDAYPRGQADAVWLHEAALYLYRHQAHPPLGSHRITVPEHYQAAVSVREVLRALHEGASINMGEKDAADRGRCYVKCHDTRNGQAYARLKVSQHRARLERTLSKELCPVRTLAQLQELRFEQLARHFAMVVPVNRSPLGQLLRPLQPLLGRRLGSVPKHRRVRLTQRDTALNERIRYALRQLTDRIATQVRRAEIRGDYGGLAPSLPEGDGHSGRDGS